MTTESPSRTQSRERRAQPRQAANLRVQVIIDGHRLAGQIVNLSPTGALVMAPAAVRLGQELMIELPVIGAVAARVQRVTSTHFAVSFEPPLPDTSPR
jgi:hypothetical protein